MNTQRPHSAPSATMQHADLLLAYQRTDRQPGDPEVAALPAEIEQRVLGI